MLIDLISYDTSNDLFWTYEEPEIEEGFLPVQKSLNSEKEKKEVDKVEEDGSGSESFSNENKRRDRTVIFDSPRDEFRTVFGNFENLGVHSIVGVTVD